MGNDRFTILGSSSGMPQGERACSGYLLQAAGRLNLIDCGGGVCSSFMRHGYDPLLLDRVFISHTHPDHCCELPLVVQMVYLAGRERPLELFVPEEFVEPLGYYLRAVYVIPERLPFTLRVVGYGGGRRFRDGFRLHAIGNRHLSGYADSIREHGLPNRMQCHSFRIETDDHRLLYSADIADFDDLRDHLDGVDSVVAEVTHLDLQQFLDFIPTSNVGRFILTHLGRGQELTRVERMVKKAGLHNLALAFDGMTIDL